MGSNSKRPKACIEDGISELPDAIRCHILSFLPTRNAVKTCILSRRWKNTWASVPNLDLCATSPNKDSDRSAGFVDRVLLFRGWSDSYRFRLRCKRIKTYFSRIDAWICTAIKRNVVELDLHLFQDSSSFLLGQSEHGSLNNIHVLPKSLFLCKTLVVLKLNLDYNVIAIVPNSNCFSSLKYLSIKVRYPIIVNSMENLFSCCPALVDLTIDGHLGRLENGSVLNLTVSAPKLKRLRINLLAQEEEEGYAYEIFIIANVPNLENLDLKESFLASYSLNNAKSLSKARIKIAVMHAFEHPDSVPYYANRIHRLFAAILNVRYLKVSGPFIGDPDIVYLYRLPMFHNLNHLELHLQRCCSWQLLTNFICLSPNLESLVLENVSTCDIQCSSVLHDKDDLVHEWCPPESVPICLLSCLKTICIRGFEGQPDEMEVAEYLLKHGEVLNKVKVYTCSFIKEYVTELGQKFSYFSRGSKTCQIEWILGTTKRKKKEKRNGS